jgi:hypothetical protein
MVLVARTAVTYGLPIVLSTVNVATGRNRPTIPEVLAALGTPEELDRTSINAWEDVGFAAAVRATGRKKLSAQLIPGAELKVYPGASHGLFQTHRDQLNADLLAFIKR